MEQTFVSGQKMTENTEKKKTFFDFVKEHKKEIAIGSATVCAVVVVVIIFKNITAANTLNIEEVVVKGLKTYGDANSVRTGVVEACHASNPPSIKSINVSEHLRNLPDVWKASQSKIDLAAQYGFSLGDHQTWVDSYTKTVA
jgi:hypothetical protein